MRVFRTIMLSGTSVPESRIIRYTAINKVYPNNLMNILRHQYDTNTGRGVIVTSEDITEIGNYVFYQCTALTSITIPNIVTFIGTQAFAYCEGLTSITIPNSVTEMGTEAFFGCTSLNEVYCKPTTPPVNFGNMFGDNASNIKIYVPTNSVDVYKSTPGWSDYADSIIGYDF